MSPDLEARSLPVATLRRDGDTQPRAGLIESVIEDYREAMAAGATFPPVTVFYDGVDYWLADGFHRTAAAERASQLHVRAEVHPGGRREATLWAAGANATHGLRRTNADKRRAVALLLEDEEWSRWSDREVARRCGVSPTFVGALRAELSVHGGQMEAARRLVERGGVTYEMDTTGIGAGVFGATEARRLTDEAKARLMGLEAIIERAPLPVVHHLIDLLDRGVTFSPADLNILAGGIVMDAELRDALPACTTEEDGDLEASILDIGVVEPLKVWAENRVLVDGYRRLAIVKRHSLPCQAVLMEFASREDALAYRLREQVLREKLTAGDRAAKGLAEATAPRA